MAVSAVSMVRLRNLFAVVMLSGIFSLSAAALYVVLDAVDVAFTEASVGAGIATVLMLGTLALTTTEEAVKEQSRNLGALLVVVITGGVLIYGTLDMPFYGDALAPIHQHVAPRYILESGAEVGVPNIVTSVLASYRGYDTLGEVTVIFTAALAVMCLMGRGREHITHGIPEGTTNPQMSALHRHSVLRVTSKLLMPMIFLFALYVQFHGDFGPGGGFQAGVIFGAAFILYALIFGIDLTRQAIRGWVRRGMLSSGVLLYAGVGVVAMLMGGNYLDYSVLAQEATHGQHLGITLIEFGVGTTVAGAMITIFMIFAGQDR